MRAADSIRISTMWEVAVLVVTCLVGQSLAQCADGNSCDVLKTIECSSNIVDSSFVLDASGSMQWGFSSGGAVDCTGNLSTIDQTCNRRSLMRAILRVVAKKLFNLFGKECMEYLESSSYLQSDSVGGCPAAGFTESRITTVWWSDSYLKIRENSLPGERFMRPRTFPIDENDYTFNEKEFINYFYEINGDRKSSCWSDGANPKIMEDCVNGFFDEILFATFVDPPIKNNGELQGYPFSKASTYPHFGLEELKGIYETLVDQYTDDQKKGTLPIFLMTDGELSGGEAEIELINNLTESISQLLPDGSVQFFGLGLVSSDDTDLRETQEDLYDNKIKYSDSTILPNGEEIDHYFEDEATANKVIDAIMNQITSTCSACYTSGSTKKCVGFDDEPPTFGVIDAEETDETQTTVNEGEILIKVFSRTQEASYVNSKGKYYIIAKNTRTCAWKYKNTDYYTFVDHDSDGACTCCENISELCFCEFTLALGTEVREIVSGSEVNVYYIDETDFLAIEIEQLSSLDPTTSSDPSDSQLPNGEDANGEDANEEDANEEVPLDTDPTPSLSTSAETSSSYTNGVATSSEVLAPIAIWGAGLVALALT